MNVYRADPRIKNQAGKTAENIAETHVKDKDVRSTLIGLLSKLHTSTKVIRNSHLKREKVED